MTAKVVEKKGKSVRLEVTVELSDSMLESEQRILEAVNETGALATQVALERFDTDGSPLYIGDTKWYCKAKQPKRFQTPYGEVSVKRNVYQRRSGGKTYRPLEERARIVVRSTPRFAKMVSHKFANGSSLWVEEDLAENHGRKAARSFLQDVAEAVGAIAQAKEEDWWYEMPQLDGEVATVSVGLDGTCMLQCEDGWREAMAGTVSLYDRQGERLHTVYLGAAPEYGKANFYRRLERELTHVRGRYPEAHFVGLADGAHENWQFLQGKVDTEILDFYHAAGYVGDCAAAAEANPLQRKQWADEQCRRLKDEPGRACSLLGELEQLPRQGLPKERREKLDSAITYFGNHHEKMDYAEYQQRHLPIGSGVTEAACKTLIKQRLCSAGMRWKNKGAGIVISLRSLVLSETRWDQFWDRINRHGVPVEALN